jgi:excisionase family DNA binding protein
MATNLLSMHHGYHGCGPISGLHFNAAVRKPPVRETRPALQEHSTGTDSPSSQVDRLRILYTRREAALLLSVSVRTIDRLIGTKALAARRIGRSVLIPHVELMKLSRRDVLSV